MFGIGGKRGSNVTEAAEFIERCMDGCAFAVNGETRVATRMPDDYLLGLRAGIELAQLAAEHREIGGEELAEIFFAAYAETQEEE